MLTDPVWWFYLTWLPSYLQRERGVTLASAAGALLVIYLAADLGSVFGGWLPGFFLRRGWSGTRPASPPWRSSRQGSRSRRSE
jgi:MFS transporter, ACS family, hexuronate transporter